MSKSNEQLKRSIQFPVVFITCGEMDKFLTKIKRPNTGHEYRVLPAKRTKHYRDIYYGDGNKAFCKICNVAVNH